MPMQLASHLSAALQLTRKRTQRSAGKARCSHGGHQGSKAVTPGAVPVGRGSSSDNPQDTLIPDFRH